jgi:hypothetical protein
MAKLIDIAKAFATVIFQDFVMFLAKDSLFSLSRMSQSDVLKSSLASHSLHKNPAPR